MKGDVMKKKSSFFTLFVIIIFLLIFLDRIVNFAINIQWFNEVGYLDVYFKKIVATCTLMVPIFIISYIGIWLYYRSLRKSILKFEKVVEVDLKRTKLERKIFIILNLIVSFFISFAFSVIYWYRILQFENATSFNVKDPVFGMDVSFYVFKLPLIESLYGMFMFLLVMLMVITVLSYVFYIAKNNFTSGDIRKPFSGVNNYGGGITKFAGKQLAAISSLIALLLSLGYLIKAWNLVYSSRGVVFGAGYTDIHVTLPFYRILAVVSLIVSIVILISVLSSRAKPIIISVAAIIVLVVINGISSVIVQNFIVKSNEKTLETKYINYNMEFTKKAFNIDSVEQKPFDVKDDLNKDNIAANKDTIDNIKVNSYEQSLEYYNQMQNIRYYYRFNDIDVDRYYINGKETEVFLAPREIDVTSLDKNTSTWPNKHLVYTHGYGVVMNKVKSVTAEGQPDFVIKDIPPNNSTDIKLDDSRVYFGEKTNDYAVVDTSLGEFDYHAASGDQTNNYNGKAGIKMSLLNKLLFSINQKDLSFLLSGYINSNSKILINRNIVDRVNKIAPFLNYDKDPYLVISGGKLYWIIDAYTVSDRYPFSQPDADGINYIRNSVKVVIDAVNGTTNFYIVDKSDPIANSYSKIFPTLFKDVNQLPQDIKDHFRYPEDLFNTQCNVMGKYHVTDAGVFYNGDDLWQVAQNQKKVDSDKTKNESSYVMMKLPGESSEEMVLIDYFNMMNKDNMVAIFGARMDANNYGKLVLYKFPPQSSINSPYRFTQQLNQNTTISQQLSLWNKDGSKVIFGDTIIVPINNSLLYVNPIYLRASGDQSIPEMKRVVVSLGDKMVLAQNIEDALQQMFNYTDSTPSTTPQVTKPGTTVTPVLDNSKIKKAKELYDNAVDAQKNGDWAKYGDYIKQLGDLLNELNK